jgi:uncharacterized protein
METLLIIVIAIIIGLCAGSISGLLGVGGGILTVPLMIFLLGLDFQSATTVSLFAILFVSITGSVEHHRNKHVDIKLGLIIGITGSVGAVLGSYLNSITSAYILEVAFAIMLFISAFRFFTKENEKKVEGRWPLPIIGLGGGFIAGLLGLGGGIVMVQGMVYIGVTIHLAIGTSMFAMIFNATAAVLTHTLLGHLNLLVALPMTAGAVLGTWGGSWFSGKVPGKKLKQIFGVFMVVIGIYMIFRALWPT